MQEIKLNFLHPTDGRMITVDVDSTMTAMEAIGELLSNNFIPPNEEEGYRLALKGGPEILPNQSFGSAGAKTGDIVKVLIAPNAGQEIFFYQTQMYSR